MRRGERATKRETVQVFSALKLRWRWATLGVGLRTPSVFVRCCVYRWMCLCCFTLQSTAQERAKKKKETHNLLLKPVCAVIIRYSQVLEAQRKKAGVRKVWSVSSKNMLPL